MLPPEIRAEIVSQFLYPDVDGFPGQAKYQSYGTDWDDFMQLRPPRPCKDFFAFGKLRTVTTSFYGLRVDVRSLGNLRLASRDWLDSVDFILRQNGLLSIDVGSQKAMEGLAKAIRPSYPTRRLVIPCIDRALDFCRHYTYGEGGQDDDDEEDVADYKDEPIFDNQDHFSESPAPLIKPFVSSQHIELLDTIFNNLPEIESFTLILPESAGTFDNGSSGSVNFYDMQVVNSCISFVKKALCSPAFCHLTDLRLHLPCTHNIGQICEALDQGARNQISRLEICIVDASGVSGQRQHLFFDYPGDYQEIDGDVDVPNSVPYSNIQREFSNQDYQDELWEFVGSCPNLEFLHIVGSNFLDLDRLDWRKSPDSGGLRVLSLERVWASLSSLQALLLPSPSAPHAAPLLRRICFGDVKLHDDGDNWEDVFNHLREDYPTLELSCMDQLTYFESHPRYASLQSPWDTNWKVQSAENSDFRAMYALANHLANRVGGWDYYPQVCRESEDDYDYYGEWSRENSP